MEDRTILIIALIVGVLGVIWLFILSSRIEPSGLTMADLPEGQAVMVKGTVLKSSSSDKVTRLTVKYVDTIDIVVFEHVDIEPGTDVTIKGELSSFRGKKELLASEISSQ
jgi:hypothetical protein